MSSAADKKGEAFNAARELFENPTLGPQVKRLWGQLNEVYFEQKQLIRDLEKQVKSLRPGAQPVSRPSTSAGIEDARQQFEARLKQAADEQANVSKTLQRLPHFDRQEARNRLSTYRDSYVNQGLSHDRPQINHLGCWMVTSSEEQTQMSEEGKKKDKRVKMNLRKTAMPTALQQRFGERNWDIQPYLYQLAIVVKGQANLLASTTHPGGPNHVSFYFPVASRQTLSVLYLGLSPLP